MVEPCIPRRRLLISKADAAHAGTYKVVVTKDGKSASTSFSVAVKEPTPEITAVVEPVGDAPQCVQNKPCSISYKISGQTAVRIASLLLCDVFVDIIQSNTSLIREDNCVIMLAKSQKVDASNFKLCKRVAGKNTACKPAKFDAGKGIYSLNIDTKSLSGAGQYV